MPDRSRTSTQRSLSRWSWMRTLVATLFTIVLIEYLDVPQLSRASGELTLLADASVLILVLALEVASVMSYTALTWTVMRRPVRLRFIDQLRIDVTGLGFSHVVPGGGASAVALRLRLMTERGVPSQDAAATAAVQTAWSGIGLVAFFVGGVVLTGPGIREHRGYAAAGTVAAVVLAIVALGMRSMSLQSGVPQVQRVHTHPAAGNRERTRRRITRWMAEVTQLGGAANLIDLLPLTPGGLGIIEGILIPSLVALGDAALTPVTLGVLTWRLFEYWLPIPVAGVTYLSLRLAQWRSQRNADRAQPGSRRTPDDPSPG